MYDSFINRSMYDVPVCRTRFQVVGIPDGLFYWWVNVATTLVDCAGSSPPECILSTAVVGTCCANLARRKCES